MKKPKGIKGLIIAMLLIAIVVGYYAYLSNRNKGLEDEKTQITAVQEVLMRDLERNYPPTPKEVIKYYSLMTQCFYNEELTEEDLSALGMKARELYDDELAANQTEADYLTSLELDINTFHDKNIRISSFSTSNSTDVEYFTRDGREWAQLYCIYNLRQGTQMLATQEVFLLRKDEKSHWKIYGWALAKNQNTEIEAGTDEEG